MRAPEVKEEEEIRAAVEQGCNQSTDQRGSEGHLLICWSSKSYDKLMGGGLEV